MNGLGLSKGPLVAMLALLIFCECACKKSAVYDSLGEIPRYGRHFGGVKGNKTTWINKNRFGYGIGRCEMTLVDFNRLTKEKGLDCQFVLTDIGDSNRQFGGYFVVDPKVKVYTALGPLCSSERGCHFYGFFAPNDDSSDGVGTLWFSIQ